MLRQILLAMGLLFVCCGLALAAALQSSPGPQNEYQLSGQVVAPDGRAIPGALVRLAGRTVTTDAQGHFQLRALAGKYQIEVEAGSYTKLSLAVTFDTDRELRLQLDPSVAITVRAEPDAYSPDPSTRILVKENVLDANPGRPGVPISVPGYPAETASGGVKAPQYFAPGVAGDHGEPIAQYFQVGNFLFPNNLPANAHGNGYADPNPLIPALIGSVQTDGAAFNVRHGNNAIDLAVTFGLRQRVEPFIQLTGDYRDGDLVIGWSPKNPETRAWVAIETSFGDGLLDRPERRQQHKINAYRAFTIGRHELAVFGLGYYGFSRIPGLVPTAKRVPGDTIDPRQLDLTHTTLVVASDTWQASDKQQLQISSFCRTYSLKLVSDFGDGLIRQSEFRTVAGGNTTYLLTARPEFSLLAGLDLRRDAPRPIDLKRADQNGEFQPITANEFTINTASPFVSIDGLLNRYFRYNLGVRRDEVSFDNQDQLNPINSFNTRAGITTPKGTLTIIPPEDKYLPIVALSYGQAFHINDPRIGIGAGSGTLVARSRAYQMVATEIIKQTELRVTLAHVTNSNELAKIDPDTGLLQDVGPSLIRSVDVTVRREFSFGSIQASFARADAIDRELHQPLPEAPRLIFDALGTTDKLPLALRAKIEYEYVGRKPLGDRFIAAPVRELRGSVFRSFKGGRLDAEINFFIASGFTGQTLETIQLPGEPAAFERPAGVRLKSYVGFGLTYHFRPAH